MFSVLLIRLRSLGLLRVSVIVMRLRMFLLLITFLTPSHPSTNPFPFIQEPPSGYLQERVLIRHHDYDQCFQSVQLLQWNSQVKFNVTVYRNLPTTRDSIMTS